MEIRLRHTIKRALERAGFQMMGNERPVYADVSAFERAITIVRPNTMLSRARMVSLADQVSYLVRSEIEGDFVECGVWKGGAVGLMAATLTAERAASRDLHLFDSFTDICAPDPVHDGARAISEASGHVAADGGEPQPVTGIYDAVGGHGTVTECRHLLERTIGYPAELVHYHEGWFQDTLPAASREIDKIALLRLDGDWYASTKVCLEHLFEKVVPSGFVVIDDYGSYEGCRKAVDEFLAETDTGAFLGRVDNGCYFLIKS